MISNMHAVRLQVLDFSSTMSAAGEEDVPQHASHSACSRNARLHRQRWLKAHPETQGDEYDECGDEHDEEWD
jgi:hypothetical protein